MCKVANCLTGAECLTMAETAPALPRRAFRFARVADCSSKGYVAFQLGVVGLIHLAHAALADEPKDFVWAEACAKR